MNERIFELAKQAKAFIVESEHAKIAEVSEVSFSKYEDFEKFAELIVRECLDCIAKVHKTEEFNEGYTLGVERCFYKIEEHFFDEEHFFGVLE